MDNTLTQIGKYTLIKQLGSGGFGAVYLAEDPKLYQQVAIKVFQLKDAAIAQQATSSSTDAIGVLKQRFLEEARILRQLSSNKYIVDLYEFDELPDGTPYYVMPYLTHSLVDEIGKDALDAAVLADLSAAERPKRLPPAKALLITEQVLQALCEVHRAGLVHRDIKPANILFNPQGDIQLTDFGIAKLPDSDHSQTGVGMGSRNYMSPEQRESAKHVDARSDLYSTAVLAYRMLTGTLPVGRFQDPIHYVPELSPAINQLLLQALETDKTQRPANAAEFLSKLRQAMASSESVSSDNTTATFVGESSAKLKAELLPLKAKITELLKQEGLLTETSKQQLSVLADIADISESELSALIQQTEQELSAEIAPFKKWRQGVEKQRAANHGQLPAELYNTLLKAGLALGKTAAELLPFLGASAVVTTQPKQPSTTKNFPLKPVAAVVLLAVLGIGGWQYQSYSTAQTALKQQDNQAWQQAQSQHSEQSYQQYLASQPNGSYRQSASQKLQELQQEAEANAQLVAEQARQQQNARSQQIRTAQQWLIKHGYTLTETGELDARTQAAIEVFEKAENLLITGEVDTTLLIKLEEAYWRKDKAAFETAKKTNTEQSYNGYLSSWLDGKYRSEAEQGLAAVKALQERAQLAAVEKAKQEAAARNAAAERAQRETDELKASALSMIGKMVTIPAGSFSMGCRPGDSECGDSEKPNRHVTISAFKLMEAPVTIGQFSAFIAATGYQTDAEKNSVSEQGCFTFEGAEEEWGYKEGRSWRNPGFSQNNNQPIVCISFDDAQAFISWLNQVTGLTFRLPSEAEWEYAARAGSSTKYSWGNSINCSQARYGRRPFGPCNNGADGSVVIKSYSANAFGLFDMHGNVYEWNQDCWNENYLGAPSTGSAWQRGDCSFRVFRGGAWSSDPGSLRVSFRNFGGTAYRGINLGFRLALDIR